MKNKLIILLLLTLTLCGFNSTKVNAETIEWSAIKIDGENVYRESSINDNHNIAYIHIGNNTVYCIEMGKDIYSDLDAGTATTTNKGTLSQHFTTNTNKTVTIGNQDINILDAIGLISKYGTELYNENNENIYYYLAAQTMMWQYLSETGVYDVTINGTLKIVKQNGTEINLTDYKTAIINKINDYYKKPNIQNNVNVTISEDGKKVFTLTDSNNILNSYKITSSNSNVKCSKSNNTTIKCEYPSTINLKEVELKFTKEGTSTNDKVFKTGTNYQASLLSDKVPAIEQSTKISLTEPKHNLKIIKKDSINNQLLLEGVSYQLCSDSKCNNVIGEEQKTNKDGYIIFNNLDANTDYYVQETATIKDYILDNKIKKVKIIISDDNYDISSLTYTVTYTNDKEEINGYIEIIKTDKESKDPLEGITFEVYDENEELVETLKTDKDGKAKTKLLPKGKYYVVEKETLEEYVLSEEIKTIEITEKDKIYKVNFENEKSPKTADTNILLVITIALCTLICAIIIYIKKINLVKNNTI